MIRSTSLDAPYRTAFTDGVHETVADVPVAKGGAGDGFGPHDLLEAALATCLTMTARMYADKQGIPLTGARCEVRIDRSVPGEVALDYEIALDGALSDEQAAQLREAVSRCPVARTLSGKITVRAIVPPGAAR